MNRKLHTYLCVLFLLLAVPAISVAQVKISGQVKSQSDGDPIVSATVVEKGTTNGVSTDAKGNFSLTVKGPQSIIQVSYVGMELWEQKVGNRTRFDILLKENLVLEEVVVVGYGTVSKSDLTGAVSSVRARDIVNARTASFNEALAGMAAGVMVASTGGEPGAGVDIKIRGASSVSGGVEPLYVVDGVPFDGGIESSGRLGNSSLNPLALINPADIESMEILKDASATAIYGSRGANGVIIITTKSAKAGKTRVNYSADFGVDLPPAKQIRVLNATEWVEYQAKAFPTYSNKFGDAGQIKYYPDDHNWQKEVMRNAFSQTHNLSVSGGNQKTAFVLSLGYTNRDGIVVNTAMDRTNASLKLDHSVNKWLKVGMTGRYALMNQQGVTSVDGVGSGAGIFQQMLVFRPTNTDVMDIEEDVDGTIQNNPLRNARETVQKTRSSRIQGDAYVQITFLPGLTLKSTFSAYRTDNKSKNYFPSYLAQGRIDNGRISHVATINSKWINENILTYTKRFNKKQALTLTGVFSIEQTNVEGLNTQTKDLALESFEEESLQYGQLLTIPINSLTQQNMISFMARANYSFNAFLFTASIRADGSSKFPAGNKYSYFPSAAVAWKAHEEPFLKRLNIFDQLKLRFSYGRTGNQSIGPYSSLTRYSSFYYSYGTAAGTSGATLAPGISVNTLGNKDLKWETTEQFNAGLDVSVLRGRLNLSADFYYKYTFDLLITQQIPYTSGFASRLANIGDVDNKGIELTINSHNITRKNFSWSTDFNISVNRNKVKSIGGGNRYPVNSPGNYGSNYANIFYVAEGYPIGAIFGYKTDGVYQLSDFNEFYENGEFITDKARQMEIYKQHVNDAGAVLSNNPFTLREGVPDYRSNAAYPGALRLKDGEQVYLGSNEPKFFGGIMNRFSYKNWDLSVFFNFSYGGKIFNANYGVLNGTEGNRNLLKDYYDNRWWPDRQTNKYPIFNDAWGLAQTTDMQVEDASYLKLKDITVGYSLPKKVAAKLGISGARVYLSMRNMFTWTKYSWYDPEYANKNPLYSALEKFSYPMPRTVVAGLAINF